MIRFSIFSMIFAVAAFLFCQGSGIYIYVVQRDIRMALILFIISFANIISFKLSYDSYKKFKKNVNSNN